jgi:hypothetical protein
LLLVPQAMPWRAPILISQINFQTGWRGVMIDVWCFAVSIGAK